MVEIISGSSRQTIKYEPEMPRTIRSIRKYLEQDAKQEHLKKTLATDFKVDKAVGQSEFRSVPTTSSKQGMSERKIITDPQLPSTRLLYEELRQNWNKT